jgi:hypothetical protein
MIPGDAFPGLLGATVPHLLAANRRCLRRPISIQYLSRNRTARFLQKMCCQRPRNAYCCAMGLLSGLTRRLAKSDGCAPVLRSCHYSMAQPCQEARNLPFLRWLLSPIDPRMPFPYCPLSKGLFRADTWSTLPCRYRLPNCDRAMWRSFPFKRKSAKRVWITACECF